MNKAMDQNHQKEYIFHIKPPFKKRIFSPYAIQTLTTIVLLLINITFAIQK